MSWTFENFEVELKDLRPEVRKKAIELANQFLAESKFPNQKGALKEGIKQAEEWFFNLEG